MSQSIVPDEGGQAAGKAVASAEATRTLVHSPAGPQTLKEAQLPLGPGASWTLPGAAVFIAMPVTLHVRVPIPGFRLGSLASLRPGSIVPTEWPSSEDLPVSAGSVRLAWAEFAVTDHARSVRVTRIS